MTPGEKETFLTLYEQSHPALNRYCLALCRNREEASDLLSETVLTALENFTQLRDRDRYRSWLFGIAVRLYRNRIRRSRRWFFWGEAEPEIPVSGSFSENAGNYTLNILLKSLPALQAEVFVLFEITDLSLKEIANIQGVGVNTVKTRLNRARSGLEKVLLKEERSLQYLKSSEWSAEGPAHE